MTREEAKEVFINRGYVNVKGGTIFDGDKWRQSVEVITEWLKQQPCEDAISRQAALEGLASIAKSKAKSDAQKSLMGRVMFFTEQLPSVSTENPNRCDLISREWLKTAIHNFYYGLQHAPTEEDIQAYIDAAPSISTEKTGRWEWNQYDYNPNLGNWHCSECRSVVIECVDKNEKSGIPLYKYCPQCGAKMEVEE